MSKKVKAHDIYEKETHQRFLVWRRISMKDELFLTDTQLDIIDQVYRDQQKQSIESKGLYRLINAVFGFFAIGLWFLVRETDFELWFFGASTVLFTLKNFVMSVAIRGEYLQFLKRQKRINDVK